MSPDELLFVVVVGTSIDGALCSVIPAYILDIDRSGGAAMDFVISVMLVDDAPLALEKVYDMVPWA